MKVKAVIEFNVPNDIVKACRKNNQEGYDEVYDRLINNLCSADNFDTYDDIKTYTDLVDYKVYDETCELLFEM